jgi:hypothetical protein
MIFAAGALLLAPLPHALAVGLVPDSLLTTLTLAMMRLALGMAPSAEAPGRLSAVSRLHWCALGLCAGLAGLAKYTAIFEAAALAICLGFWRGRALVTDRGFWSALAIAAIAVVPVLAWNARHDWISFAYQLNHGIGGEPRSSRIAVFLLVQIITYGPLLTVGACLARVEGRIPRPELLSFFLIAFMVFAILARGGTSLPHWTAPAWAALSPYSGIGLARAWRSGYRWMVASLMAVQAAICIIAFALLFSGGLPTVEVDDPGGEMNPIADLYGWKAAAVTARDLSVAAGTPYLAVQNWTLAGVLAWYARPMPVIVLDHRFDQFDLWFGSLPVGADAIVVGWSGMQFMAPVGRGQFATCESRGQQDVRRLGRVIGRMDFLHCRQWGGHAAPRRSTP